MRHLDVIWTDDNIDHLEEHGILPAEAEEVPRDPVTTSASRTTGRSIAFGLTRAGRRIAVVYEELDPVTVYPVTAYEVD